MIESKRREPVVPQRPAASEDEIKAGMRDYSERHDILLKNHSQLMAEYPDQWVAMGDNWEFVAAATHEEILTKLRDCGAYPPYSVIKRMATRRQWPRFKPLRRVKR